MINRERLRKDTPVRVKYATLDGYIWHSATVIHDFDHKLQVEFASGMKMDLPHGEGRYQVVREDA